MPSKNQDLTVDSLYAEHFSFVERNLSRLGVGQSSLDDAVQDVFLVVHRKLSTYRGQSSITTWLFGILRRVAADYRKRNSRASDRHADDAVVDACAAESDPYEDALQREGADVLVDLLQHLTPAKREVFVLAELEGLSCSEIGRALRVSRKTIHGRLGAARREIETLIERHRAQELSLMRSATPAEDRQRKARCWLALGPLVSIERPKPLALPAAKWIGASAVIAAGAAFVISQTEPSTGEAHAHSVARTSALEQQVRETRAPERALPTEQTEQEEGAEWRHPVAPLDRTDKPATVAGKDPGRVGRDDSRRAGRARGTDGGATGHSRDSRRTGGRDDLRRTDGSAADRTAASVATAALAAEAKLLGEATAAADRGELALAARRLAEHRRQFPGGVLKAERDALARAVQCAQTDSQPTVSGPLPSDPQLAELVRSWCVK